MGHPLLPRQDLLMKIARILDALADRVVLPLDVREWLDDMRKRELIP
jgi:hypothetical protein